MRISKKKLIIFSFILLTIIVGVLIVFRSKEEIKRPILEEGKLEEGKIEIEEKSLLKKGIDFLLVTDEKFVGGATYLVKKLNEICNDERLEKLWKDKIDEDIGEQKFLLRLYDSAYQYPDISNLENISHLNTRLVAKAAYCENFSFENVISDISKIERNGGYNSTHILLALAIMKEKDCYDKKLLNPLINELVKDLIITQNKEGKPENLPNLCNPSYLDIYAERAAVIGYAGYPIKGVWVENILRCQAENGSWFDSPHTTSLALWAITQKNKNCQ